MESQGLVRQFGTYTAQQLEQMKRDLKLQMPMPQLAFCASYYRAHEKRDPGIEELAMLDLFASRVQSIPQALAPTELLTNDAFVAQTYADMMKKRHELFPDAKRPATLAEFSELATAYLSRAGKERTLSDALCLIEERGAFRPARNEVGMTVSPDGRVSLRVIKKRKLTEKVGDLLVLLRPILGLSVRNTDAPLTKLLSDPAATELLCGIRPVSTEGLLYTVMGMTAGALIDLNRLSESGERIPLAMLVTAYEGDQVVRIQPEFFQAFAEAARSAGVYALPFATVQNGTRIAIVEKNRYSFSLESGFLRALSPLRGISVKLADESRYAPAPIAHITQAGASCAYLAKPSNVTPPEAVTHNGVTVAASSSAPASGFFRNALETALAPILTLAASGCDYATQRAAVALTLPANTADSTAAGECMSALLGLYRLEAELSLPLSAAQLTFDPTLAHPTVTAFAVGEGDVAPSSFVNAGNRVYCIAPELQSSGIPVFTALRKMLELLSSLRRRGILQSARVLCREAVTEGTKLMSNDTLICRVKGNVFLSDGPVPLGILVETSEPIHAEEIGVVAERSAALTPPVRYALPEKTCLIRTERPSVTVYSTVNDPDAKALAELLQANGAAVSALTGADPIDTLSRAILSSQTLIVCGKVTLPNEPHVTFAADTLRRAGGYVLTVGGAESLSPSLGIALPCGISDRMIDQICQK